MKIKTRFIRSVLETAKSTETELPWARGRRRAVFISRRGVKAAAGPKTKTA